MTTLLALANFCDQALRMEEDVGQFFRGGLSPVPLRFLGMLVFNCSSYRYSYKARRQGNILLCVKLLSLTHA